MSTSCALACADCWVQGGPSPSDTEDRMSAEEEAGRSMCPRCHSRAPRVYGLPEKVLRSQAAPRSACYFCFVRIVGIKPTRRQLLPWCGVAATPGGAGFNQWTTESR